MIREGRGMDRYITVRAALAGYGIFLVIVFIGFLRVEDTRSQDAENARITAFAIAKQTKKSDAKICREVSQNREHDLAFYKSFRDTASADTAQRLKDNPAKMKVQLKKINKFFGPIIADTREDPC
jgi:hypothetical protein